METDTDAEQRTLLLVADDLMMPSRVREGIRPIGYTLRVAGAESAAMIAATADPAPIGILVSLTARRYDPPALIRALKTDTRTAKIPLLAFAGHLEKEKHEAARTAGADLVAANSSVALHLARILPRLLEQGERRDGVSRDSPLLSFEDEADGDA